MASIFENIYKPDILSCLSDLSNDEVMTPPSVANQMLDLLPKEIWSDPSIKILDPACKSGVFLREAAKRFIEGEKDVYPELEDRLDHIFKEQLYGIAITEMTSLLSRRSVYCSKYPNGRFSIVSFDNAEGNIRFRMTKHIWNNGKCDFCGASQETFGDEERDGLESHAYEYIHTIKPEEIWNMKFDVIIGNPPYQISVGNDGGNSAKAKAIYHLFIEQSIKLSPNYLCMITPSRWMTKTTEGIKDDWVDSMLSSNKFRIIHDFEEASECFPGVDIKGGVSYFVWEKIIQVNVIIIFILQIKLFHIDMTL